MPEPGRSPTSYRRDMYLARQVVGQLRDEARETGEPLQVGGHALDAAALDTLDTLDALDALWDGLYRVDTHFWHARISGTRKVSNGSGATTSSPGSTPRVLVEVRG